MPPALKRIGEVAATVMAIGGLLSGFVWIMGGSVPPWVTTAAGQSILQRLDHEDAFQNSIALEVLDEKLDHAWERHRAHIDDPGAVDDIRRLNREIKKIDPTETLAPPPD